MNDGKDIDLLASHDLGLLDGDYTAQNEKQLPKVLIWNKLVTEGYRPSAREGHTAVANDEWVYIFGGFEAGKRVNSVASLNVRTQTWYLLKCTGNPPLPRAYHCAVSYNNYMIVHGGESNGDALPSAVAKVQNEIFPGDLIGGTKLHQPLKIKTQESAYQNQIHTLDDMFAMNLETKKWFHIPSFIAPLPRKGHSMNVVTLESKSENPFILIFGGFCIETFLVTNTVHICDAEAITSFCQFHEKWEEFDTLSPIEIIDATNPVPPVKRIRPTNAERDAARPIVWQTVQCRGTPPSPRFRHSSTLITDSHGSQLLVIVGGLGQDSISGQGFGENSSHQSSVGSKIGGAFNDVFVLNLDTLSWSSIDNFAGNSLHLRAPEDDYGPSLGIYGHSTFPVRLAPDPNKASEEGKTFYDTTGNAHDPCFDMEIIVFGGSCNVKNVKSHCDHVLHAYNLNEGQWRRIETGHYYPPPRASHGAAVVRGWKPTHNPTAATRGKISIPTPSLDTSMTNSQRTNYVPMHGKVTEQVLKEVAVSTKFQSTAGSGIPFEAYPQPDDISVIIFGGSSAIAPLSDTWALDLTWRDPGVDQFDFSVNRQTTTALQHQQVINSASAIELSYMQVDGLLGITDKELNNVLTVRPGTAPLVSETYGYDYAKSDRAQKINSRRYTVAATKKVSNTGTSDQIATTGAQQGYGNTSNKFQVLNSLREKAVNSKTVDEMNTPEKRLHEWLDENAEILDTKSNSLDIEDNVERAAEILRREEMLIAKKKRSLEITAQQHEVEVGKEFLKVRKERAQAELQFLRERERAVTAEKKVMKLEDQLKDANQHLLDLSKRYESDLALLTKQLQQSKKREQQLRQLNEESYELLLLHGIQEMNNE